MNIPKELVETKAQQSLRITCYGSSSADTPQKYLDAAKALGYLLGKRGHVCVNGAGSFGCMAAMNDGVALADGHVIGVIHSMWMKPSTNEQKEGGAHQVFESLENAGQSTPKPSSSVTSKKFKRELIIASGDDLQERKRLLVENADALIVLPGGPGTWDELWEMACAKGIGLSSLPIVCVNCDDYYGPFHEMLLRAFDEGLMKHDPEDLVHFVESAEEAVLWVEAVHRDGKVEPPKSSSGRARFIKGASFFHDPLAKRSSNYNLARSFRGTNHRCDFAFVCGVIGGVLLTSVVFVIHQRRN